MADGVDFRTVDDEKMPFTAIYLGGERQYDFEFWINGTLASCVPARSSSVEAIYERIESSLTADDDSGVGAPPSDPTAALDDLKHEMAAHPGRQAHMDWMGLRRMATVHNKNGREILGILNSLNSDINVALEMVQNVRPPDVREAVGAELDQRLHNYVASTASLIDQTRRVMERYVGMSVAGEYEKRKAVVVGMPVVGFIRDLRNFAMHRSLPFMGHSVSWTRNNEEFTAKVQLDTASLRDWDGWKSVAQTFLDQAGETIDLRLAVEEHVTIIEEMWAWVFAQYRGLHRADVLSYNELINEYNWLLTRGGRGRPRRRWAMLSSAQ
jgi:hypothetical protein